MPSKSKAKGSSFEREVSKYLSDLYSESFVRVPNSGAFIGGLNTHRKNSLSENQVKGFKGDIIPPDSWNHFNAEAKNYSEFPFHLVLAGNNKQLETWLGQLMTVSEENDLNILFIKVTRKGRFVCVPSKLTWVSDQFMYYTSKDHGDWLIMDFDHFFKNNKDLLKTYSQSSITTTTTDTKSTNIKVTTTNLLV